MSINWSFIILDKNNYIKNLVTSLNYDDLYFYEDGDEGIDLTYYFSSIHLNHLTDPIQIYSKAQQLCSLLNGLDLIIQEDKAEHYPIVLDRLIDINNEKVIVFKKPANSNVFDVDFSINKSPIPKQKNYITKVFEIAKNDDFILNLLFIISDGMTFQTLYQSYDEIRTFLKSKKDNLSNLGFTRAITGQFTHTANNYGALGKSARHGNTGQTPPQIPMLIEDAQLLITNIIRETLKKYYNIDLPIKKSIKIDVSDLF